MPGDWVQGDLIKAQRDRARERVMELEDELAHLRDEYAVLEQENLDLMHELVEARFEAQSRHPSARDR